MKNKAKKSSMPSDSAKYYSVGLVEKDNKYAVVDAFILQRVNQYKAHWRRANARNVARSLNNGSWVVK